MSITKFRDPILCFLIRRKLDQQSLAALENSGDAPTEIPTLRSVLTFVEQCACMLETISAQPTATLRHQSVHNEESCKICHLGQHNLRACSRIQQMEIVRVFKPLTWDGNHVPPQHVQNLVGPSLMLRRYCSLAVARLLRRLRSRWSSRSSSENCALVTVLKIQPVDFVNSTCMWEVARQPFPKFVVPEIFAEVLGSDDALCWFFAPVS